jgi:hypothetical protein
LVLKENANNEKDCAHQRSEHYEVDSRTSVHWITPNIAEYNQSGTIAASPKPISHHADHYPSREGSGRHLRHSTTDRMRIDPRNSLLESVPSVPKDFEVRATKIFKSLLPLPQQEEGCRQLCHRWASFPGIIKHVFSWQPGAVESGPAIADGAALFGHGSGRAYHGPSNDFSLTNVCVEAALLPNTLHRR